jgi:hypothetical protein
MDKRFPLHFGGRHSRKGGWQQVDGKVKFALWITPDTKEKVEDQYKKDNCRSKSEFIEKAITFYCGYLSSQNNREYLPHAVLSCLQGSMDSMEDRLAGILFKIAVELSMLLHVTAAADDIDESSLSRLRGMCAEEVKKLHGTVRLDDAVRYQRDDG